MKKVNIVILGIIAIAIAFILVKFADFSTYESFASAKEKPGTSFYVVGYLDAASGMHFDPVQDPNRFEFYARDKKGETVKVIFNGGKPQDIERSEELVMTGKIVGDEFHCSKIQMKCPSKYENYEIVEAESKI